MIRKYIDFSKKPFFAFLQALIFFFFIPLFSTFFANNIFEKVVYFVLSFLFAIIIAELLFLFLYRLFTGTNYQVIGKVNFERLMNEPHPYLPYIYKKNFDGGRAEQTNYPLHPELKSLPLTTNNLGYFNGEDGSRDIIIPKPKDLIRINCLGASTTGNYLHVENKVYSYPLELERILRKKTSKQLEVNNCAQGGYNSADSLVRFLLKDVDTNPDILIIYHAINDIRSYLTPGFTSDYSHSRKNLGEVYWKFFIGSKIPNLQIKFINYLKNKFLFPSSEQYSLLEVIKKGQIDPKMDYTNGLKTYERNIQHIIDISLRKKIKVVLCTFCMYLYPRIKDDPLQNLYKKIVSEENKILRKLATQNDLTLVDTASLIEKSDENFVDAVHFTPKGMRLLAQHIADKIII
tara:strand:+ start:903 stop:2114 length:1212 start_codon:yes stop_codon:yes gene_type:complete